MPNGIYALANPTNEGATLSVNEEFNILSDEQVNINTTDIDYFDAFLDEPVYSKYEENKTKIVIGWGVAAAAVVAGLAAAATVVTGGITAGLAVAATAALVGTISAGTNLAIQEAVNGGGQKIDWAAVAIAGFSGAISGAVALTPLGVGGQVVVNAGLSGMVSYTEGGSVSDIMLSTGLGALAGKLGGAGPKWNRNTNIFVPRHVGSSGIRYCYSVSSRTIMTFKNLWKGLNADQYVADVFTGISGGVYKGLATSNIIGTIGSCCLESDKVHNATDYIEKLWNKYKPDFLKDENESGSEDNKK